MRSSRHTLGAARLQNIAGPFTRDQLAILGRGEAEGGDTAMDGAE